MSKKITSRNEYDGLEKRFKTTFFNSIAGVKNACLVATKSADEKTNLAIFNSLVHIGANPPLLGLVFRPDSVERHSLENILSTEFFTINLIDQSFIAQAHQTSARYTREESEFIETGLQEGHIEAFPVPFVLNAQVSFGMKFREKLEVTSNGTQILIGEVEWMRYPDEIVAPDGFADLTKLGIVGTLGLDAYLDVKLITRFSYAKPKLPLQRKP
ncbi:MAG: flavin reductase [Flavobacteriia bacterium]|nr:flavin reductase [Flavobacteriia bacterium]